MKYNRVTRRQFLQGAGGFTLALPFLPSLIPSIAGAATDVPRRFIAVWQQYNNFRHQYWPAQDATNFVTSDVYYRDLKGGTGDISQILTNARFGTLRHKINLIRGLDCIGVAGHNTISMLSAAINDVPIVTIDNILAKSSKIYPSEPAMRALHLRPFGWNYNEAGWSISKDKTGTNYSMVPNYYNENVVFNKLFGGGSIPDGKAPLRLANKVKVVDRVFQDYLSVKTSRLISSVDKDLLENHMTRLSELQNKLKQAPGPSCGKPPLVNVAVDTPAPYDMAAALKNHIDLMVAALACKLTNIATLMQLQNPLYDMSYTHDPLSHTRDQLNETDNANQMLQVSGFHADHVSYLLKKMDAIVESNGKTLLDNSLVMWGVELGDGKAHNYDGTTIMLAGSLQGYFKTGYYMDYRRRPFAGFVGATDYVGRPYNQLLVTILQGMGLLPADYEVPGIPGAGNYIIRPVDSGADMALIHAAYLDTATRRKPLPFITTAA